MVCGIMVGSGIFASPADMLCKVRTSVFTHFHPYVSLASMAL